MKPFTVLIHFIDHKGSGHKQLHVMAANKDHAMVKALNDLFKRRNIRLDGSGQRSVLYQVVAVYEGTLTNLFTGPAGA